MDYLVTGSLFFLSMYVLFGGITVNQRLKEIKKLRYLNKQAQINNIAFHRIIKTVTVILQVLKAKDSADKESIKLLEKIVIEYMIKNEVNQLTQATPVI